MSNVTNIDLYRPQSAPTQDVRVPPCSLEAEQALLGAILHNNECFHQASIIVKLEHFVEEIHRRIFDVAGALVRESRPVTPASLLAYLGNQEVAEGLTTSHYIARLASEAVTVSGAPEYARIIRDTAIRRSLIETAEKLSEDSYNARVDASPEDIATETLGDLRRIVETAPQKQSRFQLGAGMFDLVERVERIRQGDEKPKSISTGFADLDRVTGGLRPGTITVIAARIAMGKTVAMTNLAFNVARCGVGVLEFSLEIPAEEVQARHLAQAVYDHRKPLSFSSIQVGDVDNYQAEQLILAQREFVDLPIVVECPPTITANEIAARIHVEKKRMEAQGVKLGVVMIDYLDKITASTRYAGQRTYELQEIITILKSAARAEDVCIVLLAQLNRGTEGREDKRPSLADLKSSSFIEQEAHAVIFVYREAYYISKSQAFRENEPDARQKFEDCKHNVEFILGKNRGGPETTVHLWGDVACSVLSSQAGGRY